MVHTSSLILLFLVQDFGGPFITLIVYLSVIIGFLSLGGAPAYLFEDVMQMSTAKAWFLGAVVWFVSLSMVTPGLEYTASQVFYGLTGFVIREPLRWLISFLCLMYLLTAVGAVFSDEDPNTELR